MPVESESRLEIIRAMITQNNFIEGLYQAGKDIQELASQLAPRETGDLSNSGRVEIVGDQVEVSFGNDLPDDRAIAQEFGTVYTEAQPYLFPAAREIDILFHVKKSLGLE